MSKLDFLSYINVLVVNSPHTKSLLAEKIGVSRSTLHRILSGEVEEARLSTLVNLAYALGVHPFELLRRYFAESRHNQISPTEQNRTEQNSNILLFPICILKNAAKRRF